MNTREMTPEQIRTKGLEALVRELGTVGMIRFIQLFEPGSGDYTKERKDLLKDVTLDEIMSEIRSKRDAS